MLIEEAWKGVPEGSPKIAMLGVGADVQVFLHQDGRATVRWSVRRSLKGQPHLNVFDLTAPADLIAFLRESDEWLPSY